MQKTAFGVGFPWLGTMNMFGPSPPCCEPSRLYVFNGGGITLCGLAQSAGDEGSGGGSATVCWKVTWASFALALCIVVHHACDPTTSLNCVRACVMHRQYTKVRGVGTIPDTCLPPQEKDGNP
jgi:hypothetical protein